MWPASASLVVSFTLSSVGEREAPYLVYVFAAKKKTWEWIFIHSHSMHQSLVFAVHVVANHRHSFLGLRSRLLGTV